MPLYMKDPNSGEDVPPQSRLKLPLFFLILYGSSFPDLREMLVFNNSSK